MTRVYGSPRHFAIRTLSEPGNGLTGYFEFQVGERHFGNKEARTTFALQAAFLSRNVQLHTTPWPEAFAPIQNPGDSFRFVRGLYAGEPGLAQKFGLPAQLLAGIRPDSPFHRSVLTNNMGEPFDGRFALVRAVSRDRLWILEEDVAHSDRITVGEADCSAYRLAIAEFCDALAAAK